MEGGVPVERETALELFDRYADMVYRVALSYLRSPQEAEDVAGQGRRGNLPPLSSC